MWSAGVTVPWRRSRWPRQGMLNRLGYIRVVPDVMYDILPDVVPDVEPYHDITAPAHHDVVVCLLASTILTYDTIVGH